MHEYEFRFIVQKSTPFILDGSYNESVLYAKPHYRFKNSVWEIKHITHVEMVYHDGLWFKWIHSKETPFESWSRNTCQHFLHTIGNFQDPFHVENRQVLQIDSQTKIYTFQASVNEFRLIFEWEFGSFKKPVQNFNYLELLKSLTRYRYIYKNMKLFDPPPYVLKETIHRKPVKRICPKSSSHLLYASKVDGIFGLVYSYSDKIKEKWEDYRRILREGITLGNGIVFAAERLDNGHIILLDVYQVRGHDTAHWNRPSILAEFLPQLKLVEGYSVQKYYLNKQDVPKESQFKTDGLIAHDICHDIVYKIKTYNSIDVIYYKGYFWMHDKRIPCSELLEDGSVYELSTKDGSIIRKRPDRFKGNTIEQLKRELKNGWGGVKMEKIPEMKSKRKKQIRP